MLNIWDFLLQSISLSLVAVLILIVKRIFKDKLPPSWQYGIWIIFALRALIPVRADRFVVLPFGFYIEWLKFAAESRLNSAFASPYGKDEFSHIIPVITKMPLSITDIIFTVYVFGVVAFLCFYFFSYIKLKLTLRRGTKISGGEAEKIKEIFEKNKVRLVKTVSLQGIDSAFICGVLRPVLVIPSGRETDEKVILHEIIHLKHYDSLQSIFWCIIRSLHWCNPFLHLCLNVVGNDMESRCDQRVLEMLDGEERREYGVLLLNEVNRKYARMPGTTSVSNGGKNISKRIESIVRFKKYPKGMALVSVCIILVLAIPSFFVSASFTYNDRVFYPRNEIEAQKSVIYSRLYRCTSMAGAIDTFAKGMLNQNGIMLLTASPLNKAEEITNKIEDFYCYDSGFISSYNSGYNVAAFTLFNLIKTDENRYSALLAFSVPKETTEEEKMSRINADTGTLLVPIEVYKEDGCWSVCETGERTVLDGFIDKSFYLQPLNCGEGLPSIDSETIKGKNGILERKLYTAFAFEYGEYTEQNGIISYKYTNSDSMNFFFGGDSFDNRIYRNVQFGDCIAVNDICYTYEGNRENVKTFKQESMAADKGEPFPEDNKFGFSSGSVGKNWDGTEDADYNDYNLEPDKLKDGYYKKFKYKFLVDGELADEFVFEVNVNG